MHNHTTLPPEWAEQSALLITWPHENTDWKPYLNDVNKTYIEMADAVTRHEKLIIVTPNASQVKELLSTKLTAKQMQMIVFHECFTDDTWARDHAFITLLTDEGTLQLLDFRFNGWGKKFDSDNDNAINRSLFDANVIQGEYVDYNDFVLEGGSIEADGNGTVLTTSCCLLAPNRNQPLSQSEIESVLKQRLHANRVLWISHGSLKGDDTDGHIDTLVRTAPHNTLLYIACDDSKDIHFEDLRLMEEQLKSFRTASGTPYRLIKLPMASPIFDGNDRLPATYANFIIINGAIIYPTYNQPDNDSKAAEALKMAFPDRELIAIDSRTLIRQHGSLHCCTMQIPKGFDRK